MGGAEGGEGGVGVEGVELDLVYCWEEAGGGGEEFCYLVGWERLAGAMVDGGAYGFWVWLVLLSLSRSYLSGTNGATA